MREEEITPRDRTDNCPLPQALRTGFTVLAGAAVGILIYELLRKKHLVPETGKSTTLADSITVTENGAVTRIMTFGWDNDEMCSWSREISLDESGNIEAVKLIEVEYSEGRIQISESAGEDDPTPVFSTVLQDEYGMAKAVTRRNRSGRETRWDEKILGAELMELTSDGATGSFEWEDGNIVSISFGGNIAQRMTYYKSIENHLFPDLNFLPLGLSSDMLLSHVLGTRTRNFLSTLEVVTEEEIKHYSFSYLFDAEDRPLQIHQELYVLDVSGNDRGEGRRSVTDYDIKYLKK